MPTSIIFSNKNKNKKKKHKIYNNKNNNNRNNFTNFITWIMFVINFVAGFLVVVGYSKSVENLNNIGSEGQGIGTAAATAIGGRIAGGGGGGGGRGGVGDDVGGDISGNENIGGDIIGNVFIAGNGGENLTFTSTPSLIQSSDNLDNSLFLNNFMNISNSVPELIEYYELDEDISGSSSSSSSSSASSSASLSSTISPQLPDIYPDPEELNRKIQILNNNNNNNNNNHGFNNYNNQNNINKPSTTTNYNKELEARDNDFKGHDFIDNIMYIYYGSNNTLKNSIGSSIVIGGSVLALAAQILCSILMILRNRSLRRQNALFYIFLNFAIILLLSNLIFILGVQSTKNEFRCGMVAIVLHYCHLCTTVWGLIYIYIIYDYIVNDCGINLKYNYFMAYGVPAVYVLFSCAISSTSYEIVEYCWMSVQRGMIINFMIPVSGIIVASTILGTLCLREIATKQREVIAESIENILENAAKCHEINSDSVIETDKCCEWDDRLDDYNNHHNKKNDFYDSKFDLGVLSIVDLSLQSSSESQDFSDFKNSIKFLLFFQPAFAVCWFFSVVALENRESCVMPIVFVISYNIMNWYFLIRSPYICPIIQDHHQIEKSQTGDNGSNFGINGQNLNGEEINHHSSSCTDTIPLLCTPTSLQQQQHQQQQQIQLQNQKISAAAIVEDCMNEVQLNISTWTDSIGDISCNMDSISTISS